jgi:hypothetical protein
MLSYYTPTSYTKKPKLMEKGGQFTYTPPTPPPPPSVSDFMLSYYTPSSCNKKGKLIEKDGQFIYTSTHKTQSGQTLLQTLCKQELHALGCPLFNCYYG